MIDVQLSGQEHALPWLRWRFPRALLRQGLGVLGFNLPGIARPVPLANRRKKPDGSATKAPAVAAASRYTRVTA
jgi:hypothetical protein